MAKHIFSMSLQSPTSVAQRGYLQPQTTCSTDSEVFCCELNPAGDMIASSLSDGSVMVFETQTGSLVYKLPLPSLQEKLPATAIRFKPIDTSGLQNVALVTYSSGHVHQWHISTGKSLTVATEKRQTLAAVYAPDASTFTTSGSDCKLLVYDSSTGKCQITLEASSDLTTMDGHMNRVFALRYHPSNSNLLVSAGWDDTVQFWDTRVAQSIRKLSGPHICGDSLDIEPLTLNIVTGSWRYHTPLEIWDFDSGKLLSPILCCSGTKLYSTCWMSDRYVLVGGSQKHCSSVIDIDNDTVVDELNDLSAGVYSVHYNKNTKMAAIASGTKMYLCPMPLSHAKTIPTFITEYEK